jgi:NAD(P)-dependent dehydrogenase (short-subunit alcohol dehydrogenase family)
MNESRRADEISNADLLSLDGRVAVVTGGAAGIGAAIVRRFVAAGARCLVADVSTASEELADLAGSVTLVRLDVRDAAGIEALADQAVAAPRRLDIWVNNAGIFPRLDPLVADPEVSAQVLDINVHAVERAMQIAAVRMIPAGRGVILNVISTASFRGAGTYSASKWAVRGLTAGLAPVVGPHGIRVVGVAPTLTATAGLDAFAGTDESGAALVRDVAAKIPLRRIGTADDVARAALFLVSDAAAFVTGHTLVVDGGSMQAM